MDGDGGEGGVPMTTRDDLHQLIEELPESDLPLYLGLLDRYRHGEDDPLLRKLLLAPFDDEPVTEEERAAVEEALEDIRHGRVVSHEEIMREFGR